MFLNASLNTYAFIIIIFEVILIYSPWWLSALKIWIDWSNTTRHSVVAIVWSGQTGKGNAVKRKSSCFFLTTWRNNWKMQPVENKSIFREYNIYVTKIRKSCRSSFANIIKYNQRFFLIDCSHWIHHRNVTAVVIFTTISMLLTCKWRTLQIKYQIWYFSSYSYLIQTGLLCLVFWPLKFTVRTKTNNIHCLVFRILNFIFYFNCILYLETVNCISSHLLIDWS